MDLAKLNTGELVKLLKDNVTVQFAPVNGLWSPNRHATTTCTGYAQLTWLRDTQSPTRSNTKMKYLVTSLAVFALLTACGKSDVSFTTLEEAKTTVRENALFNAQRFRAENPKFDGWSVVSNGDSSQINSCPQGDGWATLTFISPDRKVESKVKCSTVSGATGCLQDAEFKGKPFASEDGRCNANVPFPIPKIAK